MLDDFFLIVNEMAPGTVRAETDRVVSAAQLRLVLWMARKVSQLSHTVRELTFVTVFTHPELFVWSAQLRLVPGSVDVGGHS